MISQLTPKERLGYGAVILVMLFGMGYVGGQYLKRPPEIRIDSTPSAEGLKGQGAGSIPKSEPAPTEVVIDVAGAVKKPGLYRLAPGSRVADAIQAAGGTIAHADVAQLNLAARLIDGSQLLVPRIASTTPAAPGAKPRPKVQPEYRGGQEVAAQYSSQEPPPAPKASPSGKNALALASINLNTADAQELDLLPGVGPVTAQKIIEYRTAHGSFASIDELLAVKGIGPKKLEQIRPYVRL